LNFAGRCLGKQPRFLRCSISRLKKRLGEKLRHASAAACACSRPSRPFIATVVEAEVDQQGEVSLRRIVSVVDTGIAVNPDTVIAQLEGGLIFGLTAALYGEITIDRPRAQI